MKDIDLNIENSPKLNPPELFSDNPYMFKMSLNDNNIDG